MLRPLRSVSLRVDCRQTGSYGETGSEEINGKLLEADFWHAWVNFRIPYYSSNRRIPFGVRYSDYIHHGMVSFSQRVNVPVGPSGPSKATRTTSREPSSTEAVPSYPLRFVLVKPGVTRLILIPVDSSSIIMASVIALRAVLDAE